MTWTVQNYLDRTRSIGDAQSSARWDDAIDVLPALGLAHTREWKRLLNANQYLRVNSLSLAQDVNGQIATSALDTGSADSQKRLYRVLWISDGVYVYDKVDYGQVPLATVTGGNNTGHLWYRSDATIQLLPSASSQVMTVVVNHTPTPIDQLAGANSAVEFPRDYELILCHEAAAWLLAKGGGETNTTADLQRLADQIRSDMLGDLARESTQPKWIAFPDSAREWGAV